VRVAVAERRGKSRRTVPLPPELVPILKAHRTRQKAERLAAANIVRDARVHDGRHTAGTLLVEQGVHVRTVQEILGHSGIRITQRYTHVATPMAEDGMQRMGKALWGS
jgi:integrase